MKAAICFLTFNRLDYTKQSIQSILKNTNRNDYDLIWWDNGSTQDTLDYAKSICDEYGFDYIFFKTNQGLTRAMNNQMKFMDVKGAYDVFCHIANDIIVPPNWLEGVFKAVQNEKVGVVGLNLENAKLNTEAFDNITLEVIKDEFACVGGMHFCISKRTYDILGGFRRVDLGYGQQDANYCLKVKLLPDDIWCYYLPLKEYAGTHLGTLEGEYKEYHQTFRQRLRNSGSDVSGGRNYRFWLMQKRKEYDKGKINRDALIRAFREKNFTPIDKSKLLATSLKGL